MGQKHKKGLGQQELLGNRDTLMMRRNSSVSNQEPENASYLGGGRADLMKQQMYV